MLNIIILLAILGALWTLKFFVDLFEDVETKFINIRGGISALYMLIVLSYLAQNLSEYDSLLKYSTVPTLLIFHLLLCCFLCTAIFYLSFLVKAVWQSVSIVKFINYIFCQLSSDRLTYTIFNKVFYKIEDFIIRCLHNVNIMINPFYNIDKSRKRNSTRVIKMILIISYLISGMIILSPFINYINIKDSSLITESFKRDYELYKNVFVISLIPFSINFLINKKENKEDLKLDNKDHED